MTGDWGGGRSRGPSMPPAASTRPQTALSTWRLQSQDPEVEARPGLTLTRGEGPWVRPAAHTHTCTPGGRAQTQCTRTCGSLEAQTEGPRSPSRGESHSRRHRGRSSVGAGADSVLSSLPGAGGGPGWGSASAEPNHTQPGHPETSPHTAWAAGAGPGEPQVEGKRASGSWAHIRGLAG